MTLDRRRKEVEREELTILEVPITYFNFCSKSIKNLFFQSLLELALIHWLVNRGRGHLTVVVVFFV